VIVDPLLRRAKDADALAALPIQWRFMMNSLSTGHDSSDAPASSGTQASPAAVDPASANADASASSHDEQNPLWLIAAAMALFFAVAAAFLVAS
jgi:hypothetical protein